MSPKRLVIYGSCQAVALYDLLREEYPDAFDYQCLPFYQYAAGVPLPDSIWDAELFVYQPLLNSKGAEDRRQYETDAIVRRLRERGANCYGFPYLHFSGYHPDYCRDPLNEQTVTPEHPWGAFAYGMEAVMQLRGKMPVPRIVERTKADDFLAPDYVRGQTDRSLSGIRAYEAVCDVKVADWVAENFRRRLLFHSVNHPANAMLQRLYDPVFEHLGLPRIDLSRRPEILGVARPPVYPCVRRCSDIRFDVVPVLAGRETTYDRYMTLYASLSEGDAGAGADGGPIAGTCLAALVCGDFPRVMKPAAKYPARLDVCNESLNPWHPPFQGTPAVRVSYHWLREGDGEIYQWDNPRVNLPRTVMPGESIGLEVTVEAPERPGAYRLTWDLVIEGVTWFSTRGCRFPESPVAVEAGA